MNFVLEAVSTAQVPMGTVFLSEFLGTMFLMMFGTGVCATNTLTRSNGKGDGWLLINFGWGFAVFIGVYVAFRTGGHLNPAVTLGMVAAGKDEFMPGIPITGASIAVYIVAQMLGAFVGSLLAWLAYKKHYDAHENAAEILGTFSTGPAIKSYGWNFVTETIATFTLVSWVLVSGYTQNVTVGPLAVALVIVAIGASLGGATGYAINPARDLAPRVLHAILPIPNKGDSNWGYAWVPVLGPLVGAVIAGVLFGGVGPVLSAGM
ncbi:MAG: aquaporin family protein [Actinomycetaceae bacterium]|nr:aquaporin family protein [Arcanobacterium sp.]MDD7505220.1 aquaporin family protein [Actinomycetaceae bacterium]MDY6143308.1 MIP/aquaporin family protein [Arcanobacterium sp.]